MKGKKNRSIPDAHYQTRDLIILTPKSDKI